MTTINKFKQFYRLFSPFLGVLFVLAFSFQSRAQWVPADSLSLLSVVKKQAPGFNPHHLGGEVIVSGVANVASGTLHEVHLQTFLQNDSAGVALFQGHIGEPIAVGDSVVVRGRVQIYFSQPEIHVEQYRVYHTNSRINPLNLFNAMQDSTRHLGMLVHGTGIIRDKGFQFNGKYLTISPNDNSNQRVNVFVSNFNANYYGFDFETPRVGDAITVTGVIGQYTPDSSAANSFKVYPRTPDDLSYASLPYYYLKYSIIGLIVLLLIVGGWMVALRIRVKRKTQALEDSLAEKEVLLKEIHHRVKNNLAIISGLLELQKGTTVNSEVQNALHESQSRISSMAIVHDKLYRSESLSAILMETYLIELADTIHDTFAHDNSDIQINVDSDPLELNIDQVLPLGLLVNELLVNAIKHAFKNDEDGCVWIELKKEGEEIMLQVRDNGVGLPENIAFESSDSLGMLLINTFSQQLHARKTVKNDEGACFTFYFPFSHT